MNYSLAKITLDAPDKPRTPDDLDRLITAEIPDDVTLFERVPMHMLHRDCGSGSLCWREDYCLKRFPKAFQDVTDMDLDGFPAYKRRNDEHANIRAQQESEEFKRFLLEVGDDKRDKDDEERIEIPLEMRSNGNVIDEIFEGIYHDPDHINVRANLCPRNNDVNETNSEILSRMTERKVFLTADSIEQENGQGQLHITNEFLNKLTPAGMSHHRLMLRIGTIVMLNKNLNVRKGLCNGSRLQVEKFHRMNAIQCRFINGTRKGKSVMTWNLTRGMTCPSY